jgi:DNA-binding MarR family transcriptional regulator
MSANYNGQITGGVILLLSENAATQIAWKLGMIYRLHMQNIAGINENFGLYSGQTRTLQAISEMNGATQRELADRLNITPASLAVSVKRMQKAGIVEKVADQTDLRSNRIHITEKGRKILSESLSEFIRFDNSLLIGFSPEEMRQLDAYLLRIHKNQKEAKALRRNG